MKKWWKKPSFFERGGTAPAVGDSRRVRLIGKTVQRKHMHANPADWHNSATKKSPLSLKEGGPRQRWVIAGGSSWLVRQYNVAHNWSTRHHNVAHTNATHSHKPASSPSSTASGPPPSTWKEAWVRASSWVYSIERRLWVMHTKAFFLWKRGDRASGGW